MKKAMGALSFLGMTFMVMGLAMSQVVYTGLIVDARDLSFTPRRRRKFWTRTGGKYSVLRIWIKNG